MGHSVFTGVRRGRASEGQRVALHRLEHELGRILDGRHRPIHDVAFAGQLQTDARVMVDRIAVFAQVRVQGGPHKGDIDIAVTAGAQVDHALQVVHRAPPALALEVQKGALVTGVIVGVFGLRRASKDADPCNSGRVWRLYAGIAFAYLLTAMFSKHAFMNYYYLVYFALVVALVWSRIADRESDSLEPE